NLESAQLALVIKLLLAVAQQQAVVAKEVRFFGEQGRQAEDEFTPDATTGEFAKILGGHKPVQFLVNSAQIDGLDRIRERLLKINLPEPLKIRSDVGLRLRRRQVDRNVYRHRNG